MFSTKTKPSIFWVLIFSAFIFSCTEPQPITLATYTYHTNDRLDNMTPLAELLSEKLEVPMETKSYKDVESLIKGIQSGEADIALINTLGYLLLSQTPYDAQPVAALKIPAAIQDNYKTVLLARAGLDLGNLDGLAQKADELNLTLVNKGSTSGNLVPRLMLSSLGIDSPENAFATLSYSGNHTEAMNRILSGETDLAAFGSNEYFEQLEAKAEAGTQSQLVWISEEIPLGPVMVQNAIAPHRRQLIIDCLHGLDKEHPEVLEAIKGGWSEAKNASHYATVDETTYRSFSQFEQRVVQLDKVLKTINE